MKTNNKALGRRVGTALIAVTMLFTFNQCVQEYEEVQEVAVENQTQAPSPYEEPKPFHGEELPEPEEVVEITPPGAVETGATEVARTVSSVGVLNYEQIDATFAALTGVNRFNNNTLRDTYEDNRLGLPGNNSVKEFNASNAMAVFKLASAYCSEAEDNGFFTGIINTNSASNTALSAGQRGVFVDAMVQRLWGQGVESGMVMQQTREELMALVDELAEGEPNSAATTRGVAIGVCSAMLSAPQVIYL